MTYVDGLVIPFKKHQIAAYKKMAVWGRNRDAVNKRVIADMQETPMPQTMPFDVKRMAYGEFRTVVQG